MARANSLRCDPYNRELKNSSVFINPAYTGDYDTVSSDVTGANSGFFNTFQIQTNTNPDVFGMRLKF